MRDSHEPFVTSDLQADGLLFREVFYPDGYDMPAHEHDIDCFVLVLQGTMSGRVEREKFEAPDSTLAFMPAGRPHSSRFHRPVRTFDVVLSSDYAEEYRPFLSGDVRLVMQEPASLLASRMHHEFRHRDRATPLILSGLTLELLGRMSRWTAPETGRPRWLGDVLEFVHENLSRTISLQEVAAAAGVHPAHLTRVFRKHFGCTIGDYSRRLRLDRACAAMARGDKSLADLALEAGFSDQSHFSRAFKAYTGLTPGQYRQTSAAQLSFKTMHPVG